jgi:hypothetical protein
VKNNQLLFAVSIGLALLTTPVSAWAIFGADEFKIEKFCEAKSPRQTLIYVDEKILVKGETQWAEDVHAKLSANLMPSESVTLIKLAAETGETQELWKGCYPDYTATDFAKIKLENGGFFGSDPVKQLKNQQAFFRKQLGDALGKLLNQSGRERSEVQIDAAQPPKKQIIRALSNDGARFDSTHGAIRTIIYSDMVENSDLGSSLKPKQESAAANLALDFKNAVFYVYGAGSTLSAQGSVTDGIKSYWETLFNSAEGHLLGFGPNLIVASNVPLTLQTYAVEISINDKDIRRGKMQLFIDREGNLQDSFIAVAIKRQSMLQEGSFSCQDASCTLSARVPTSVITAQGSAEIKLGGSLDSLKGTIQIPDAKLPDGKDAIFDMTAKLIK